MVVKHIISTDMKKGITILLLAFCAASCGRQAADVAPRTFTLDSFETITLPAGETYGSDGLFLGDPHIIRVHPDGYLVVLDVRNTDQVAIIDLATGRIQTSVKHGRGPNEMISVRDITVRDGDIWLSGMSDQKILRLAYDSQQRGFTPEPVCRTADQFLRAVPFTGDRILTLASASSENRFHLLGRDGVTRDTVGVFPASGHIAETAKPNNAIYQSDISVSPDGRHTAVVCRSLEYIDIYDADMNLTARMQGPQGIDPGIKVIGSDAGARFVQDPMWFVFNDVVSDNDGFAVGYIGISPKTDADFDAGINTILTFDWKGRPQKAYKLESDAVSFDIDRRNGRMYCLVNTPEPVIMVYDLAKLK